MSLKIKISKPTCFYCSYKCHTFNACCIKNICVPNGIYVCVDKGTNPRGAK